MIRLTDEYGRIIEETFRKACILPELVEQLQDQLNHPNREQDLFEMISGLIMGTTQRIALPGSLLASLKKILLSPKELATSNMAAKSWQACSQCNRKIDDGEAAVLVGQMPTCIRCASPTIVKCGKCQSVQGFPVNGFQKMINKVLSNCVCFTGNNLPRIEPNELKINQFDEPPRDVIFNNPDPAPNWARTIPTNPEVEIGQRIRRGLDEE